MEVVKTFPLENRRWTENEISVTFEMTVGKMFKCQHLKKSHLWKF